jgi:hypothetical protein
MRVVLGVVCAALLWPGVAAAQDGVRGRTSLTLKGGVENSASGDLHEGGSGVVLGLPTSVQSRSFDDVYKRGFRFGAGLGYGVAENVEVIGNVTFGRQEAELLQVGTVAGLVLNGLFTDYKDVTVEGGLRLHLGAGNPIAPYVNLVGGFRRVEAIPATFSVPAAGVVLADTPFYDASTVGLFGGDFGLGFNLGPNVSLGVEAGLRWQGKLNELEGLAGTGLENLNDVGSRWTLPVSAALTFRF